MRSIPERSEIVDSHLKQRIAQYLLLVIITTISYLPAFKAEFLWDDKVIYENPALRSLDGLYRIWVQPSSLKPYEIHYWPLTHSSFWLEYQIHRDAPRGYHETNLLLYVLTVLLLFRVLNSLKIAGAWLAAAIFAVHPIHVETVVWITERKGLLAGLLCLLSLHYYLRTIENRSPRSYFTSLALFLLALLAKSTVLPLPAFLVILGYWRKGRLTKEHLLKIVPFATMALLHAAFDLTLARQGEPLDFSLTVTEKMVIAAKSSWFYIGKILCPTNLLPVYQTWDSALVSVTSIASILGIIALPGVLILIRKRIGRAPLVGLLFYWCALAPTLGFIEFGYMRFSYVADRFQYLASLAPIILTVSGATALLRAHRDAVKYAAGTIASLVLITLSVATYRYSSVFTDELTLFNHVIAHNPNSFIAHYNVADEYAKQGETNQAVEHYRRAAELKPGYGDVHFQLGSLLLQLKNYPEAEHHLRIDRSLRPHAIKSIINYGNALFYQDRHAEALRAYQDALYLDPTDPMVHNNMGFALIEAGRLREALDHFSKALPDNRDSISLHLTMAQAYQRLGDDSNAATSYYEALRLNPNELSTLNNLAWILTAGMDPARRNPQEAIRLANRAREIDQNEDPNILDTLGVAYAVAGDLSNAQKIFDLAEALARGDPALVEEIRGHRRQYLEPLVLSDSQTDVK